MLDAARSMPLSASVMVNRDEFGEILAGRDRRAARGAAPGALAAEGARRGHRAGRARGRRGSSTSPGSGPSAWSSGPRSCGRPAGPPRTPSTRPGASPPQMRLEAEDYVDRKLAGFEVVLDRTMQTGGRRAASGSRCTPRRHEDLLGPEADEAEQAFFDQDET